MKRNKVWDNYTPPVAWEIYERDYANVEITWEMEKALGLEGGKPNIMRRISYYPMWQVTEVQNAILREYLEEREVDE